MAFPDPPRQYVAPSLLLYPPVMYLVVRSAAAFTYEGFSADAVQSKGKFYKVDELVIHFIVTSDDESYTFSNKCMTYGEGSKKTPHFSGGWGLRL